MEYWRPLTDLMIRQMLLVRSFELSRDEEKIGLLHHFPGTLRGLYRRGYVNTRKVQINGKEIMGVYLTEAGINFVNNYVAGLNIE
ncbi:MAG: hypothetical protein M3015_14595 [Bacteroidota bacterium]|nr:hypothetical protein [Bacteroidota bacterium]